MSMIVDYCGKWIEVWDGDDEMIKKRIFHIMAYCCIAALGASNSGCSQSDRAEVSGQVSLQDGTPLVGARVMATPTGAGKTAYGSTDDTGKYVLSVGEIGEGLPSGEYQVVVLEVSNRREGQMNAPKIASKYADSDTSGLSFTVDGGQSKELDLTLDPP
jgi:hypothetical protein